MSDEDFWVKKMGVPKDRYQRRKDALLKQDKHYSNKRSFKRKVSGILII